jgi:glycosyltransferase involved in cell wall biosynthesis
MSNQSPEVVIKHMLSCSVLVLPSYTEGFPNVILEGMACGCPIVATSVGAIPEMLNYHLDAEAGICIIPGNVEILQRAIEQMLDDKIFAKKCGQNARDRVISEYSIEVIWHQLITIWENALK